MGQDVLRKPYGKQCLRSSRLNQLISGQGARRLICRDSERLRCRNARNTWLPYNAQGVERRSIADRLVALAGYTSN